MQEKERGAPIELYLVSSSQTYYDLYQKLQGWSNAPLTGQGIAEAQEAGSMLKELSFDAIFTSDLGRAVETAAVIRGFLAAAPLAEVQLPELREVFYGGLEGNNIERTYQQAALFLGFSSDKEMLKKAHPEERSLALKALDPFHQVEEYAEYAARLKSGFQKIRDWSEENGGRSILVVTHNTILDCLIKQYASSEQETERSGQERMAKMTLQEDESISLSLPFLLRG